MNVDQRQSEESDDLRRAEKRTRLNASVKAYDGFFSTFFVNPYAKHLAGGAASIGLSPTLVTIVSLVVGLGAAGCFAVGGRGWLVAGALLLLGSFYLDGVDGTLARFTGRSSAFGAWLDSMCDRCKEYAVYAGLAIGSSRAFDHDVWLLAACALALQTIRHTADVAYVRAGLARATAPPATEQARRSQASGLAGALRRSSVPVWVHRVIRFPVGERLVLIAVTAALFTPRTTFLALLVWGGVAGLYTLVGRLAYDHPATRRAVRSVLG